MQGLLAVLGGNARKCEKSRGWEPRERNLFFFRKVERVEGLLRLVKDEPELGQGVLQAGDAGGKVFGEGRDLFAGILIARAGAVAEGEDLLAQAAGPGGGGALGLGGAAVGGELLFR